MFEARYYRITDAAAPVRLGTAEEALAAVDAGDFVWLDLCEPTRDDLAVLSGPLGLHPLAIENCVDDRQIPKIDDFARNTFLLLNTFRYADHALTIAEVDIFLGDRYLVTASGRDVDGRPLLAGLDQAVETHLDSARRGPAFLLHVLLDHLVDRKFTAIEAIEEELDSAEEAILNDLSHFSPADLLHLRRDLLAVRKSLFHEREVLGRICRRDCPFVPEPAIIFYRDVYDYVVRFFELTESSRDMVTSLMEMYLSMVNNQMARAANQTNLSVRRLTLITTIFMPLSLLASIGGMSEWSMITGPGNWRLSYPGFLVAMTLIGVANYYLLKRLESRD